MKKNLIISLLFSGVLLTGCISSPSLAPEQRPQHWGQQLSQSHNFYQISKTLYRSEQPDASLIPQLEKQGIVRIINLRQRNPDIDILSATKYTLVHIPINTWAIDRNDLLQVMQSIQQAEQRHEKVMIHCYHGSDRTGASVAMYRIIFQGWKTEDALNEMKYGGYGFHPIWRNIEKQFSPENIQWIGEQLAKPNT